MYDVEILQGLYAKASHLWDRLSLNDRDELETVVQVLREMETNLSVMNHRPTNVLSSTLNSALANIQTACRVIEKELHENSHLCNELRTAP